MTELTQAALALVIIQPGEATAVSHETIERPSLTMAWIRVEMPRLSWQVDYLE